MLKKWTFFRIPSSKSACVEYRNAGIHKEFANVWPFVHLRMLKYIEGFLHFLQIHRNWPLIFEPKFRMEDLLERFRKSKIHCLAKIDLLIFFQSQRQRLPLRKRLVLLWCTHLPLLVQVIKMPIDYRQIVRKMRKKCSDFGA